MHKKKVRKFIDLSIKRVEQRMKEVRLRDATDKELKQHMNETSGCDQTREFHDNRSRWWFTHGTFNRNPLIVEYEQFLRGKKITTIVIDV